MPASLPNLRAPRSRPCSPYFVWLGWLEWRAQRRAQARTSPPPAAALAERTAGALALLLGLAALAAAAGPVLARHAARTPPLLARMAAFALGATVCVLAARTLGRLVRFVRELCERGQRIDAKRRAAG